MRLRFTVLAVAVAAAALAAVPGVAGAAPRHSRGLTIHAVPHSIIAGEAVLIFGQLEGPDHGNQVIRLYHRVNPNRGFTLISTTHTDPAGQYEFTRAEGLVLSNRSWFVRGPAFTHSRTVHEGVAALLTIAPSAASAITRHPITFSGHVTPNHTGDSVALQVQKGSSNNWRTLKRGVIGPGSNYQIPYAFRVPGAYDLRALFGGDARNTSASSDITTVVVQQAEVPDFTIQTSDPIVTSNAPFTISGTLLQPGTTTPEPATMVSLFTRQPHGGRFREVMTTTTGMDGSYSFANLESSVNELYRVRTTFAPARHTEVLFEGVQDVVTMTSSSSTSTVDGHITFSGSVSPDKAGHVIYLQKLGADSDWHTVEVRTVTESSTFQFGWTFGNTGVKQFRARITGGPANVGGASAPVTIDVTAPPLSSLPTG